MEDLKKTLLGPVESAADYEQKLLSDTRELVRLLDGASTQGDRTSYMTYPRSGNTFLRKYLELITGVGTGSDIKGGDTTLFMQGNIGEGQCTDNVWVIKTHYPWPMSPQIYEVNKFIVTARNPFDCLISNTNFW